MISSSSETIDKIFNAHKIKFEKMNLLFGSVGIREVIDRVNIFINLESIIHCIHNQTVEEFILSMDKTETKNFHFSIISNILNLAGHYRRFFTKNRIKTNIVLFMNEYDKYTTLNNTMFLKHYRERFIYDYTDNPNYEATNMVLESVIKALRTIVGYVEGVYLVTSNRLESSLVPLLLCNSKALDGQLNILITRDEYDLQYVNKNFLVMYPKGDESYIVTKENLFTIIREKHDIKNSHKLPAYLITFILAIVGDKRRGIGKIKGCGWKTIYKRLHKLFKELDISEAEIIGLEHLIMAIKDGPNDDNKERIANSIMCVDLDRQLGMVSEPQQLNITKQLVDKYENDALKNLNSKYFEMSPINVVELNQYSARSKKSLF